MLSRFSKLNTTFCDRSCFITFNFPTYLFSPSAVLEKPKELVDCFVECFEVVVHRKPAAIPVDVSLSVDRHLGLGKVLGTWNVTLGSASSTCRKKVDSNIVDNTGLTSRKEAHSMDLVSAKKGSFGD